MKESKEEVIRIEDLRYPIFTSLLEFIYTEKIDDSPDVPVELLIAADQFGLTRLKVYHVVQVHSDSN